MSEIVALTNTGGNGLGVDDPMIYTFIDVSSLGNTAGYDLQLETWYEGTGKGTWTRDGLFWIK